MPLRWTRTDLIPMGNAHLDDDWRAFDGEQPVGRITFERAGAAKDTWGWSLNGARPGVGLPHKGRCETQREAATQLRDAWRSRLPGTERKEVCAPAKEIRRWDTEPDGPEATMGWTLPGDGLEQWQMDAIDDFIAGRVRQGRETAGVSQSQLAKAIGVTFQQVQKYEKGVTRITAGRLALIAKALGMTPAELFDGAPGCEAFAPSSEVLAVMQTGDGIRMASALASIFDPPTRSALVSLVEAAAAALRRADGSKP